MRPFRWPAAALVLASLLVVGCTPQADAEPVATDQVDLPQSYRFAPEAITVPAGTTVTWTNNDQFTHNVRLLDIGGEILTMAPGESASFTFEEAGEYRYDCSLHPNDMSGVVIVGDR